MMAVSMSVTLQTTEFKCLNETYSYDCVFIHSKAGIYIPVYTIINMTLCKGVSKFFLVQNLMFMYIVYTIINFLLIAWSMRILNTTFVYVCIHLKNNVHVSISVIAVTIS